MGAGQRSHGQHRDIQDGLPAQVVGVRYENGSSGEYSVLL